MCFFIVNIYYYNLRFHIEIYTQLRYNKEIGYLFAFILYKL